MALLPAGFVLPPLAYLVALAVGVAVVAGALWRLVPAVTADTVLGLAPWMAVGSALHAWFVLGTAPARLAPLFGAPAVYATVFVVLGAIWAGLTVRTPGDARRVARWLGGVGAVVFVLSAVAVLVSGPARSVFWPLVGLGLGTLLAAVAWTLLGYVAPTAMSTGWPGALVVFAHSLDGVSTAVGVDVLGFGERTPLSRAIMDVAAAMPTTETFGVGWLFVLVKIGVAGGVVVLFAELVEEDPRKGYLLLAVIAAVGLGPGVHNLLLYAVAG